MRVTIKSDEVISAVTARAEETESNAHDALCELALVGWNALVAREKSAAAKREKNEAARKALLDSLTVGSEVIIRRRGRMPAPVPGTVAAVDHAGQTVAVLTADGLKSVSFGSLVLPEGPESVSEHAEAAEAAE